ncbi:MAG: FAD-binding oxidoreductase [Candidatus Sericytochromatia bacterium]|nr:FAD-binding oxidoreductase [Candidatus Tanganyikabacteria bacterium]
MVRMLTRWFGWGDPTKSFSLDDRPRLWPALTARIGEPAGGRPPVALDDIALPAPGVSESVLVRLAAAAGGADALTTDHEARVRHAFGKSYRDLVRLRRGTVGNPPVAVLAPGSHEAVAAVLAAASELGMPVVPFGGGTSVVGGVEGPPRPYLVVSLARLDRVLALDRESRTARIQAGILGPDLERQLEAQGFTLGHYPQSFEFSTLGGWIAARSAGQQSTRYGKIEDMVVALRLATPAGELATPCVPAASDGPDLNRFLAGSEGTCGIITEATLRVRPVPRVRRYQAALLRDFSSGARAVRTILQAGGKPATLRLSDAAETEGTFALRRETPPGPGRLVAGLVKRMLGPLDGRCLLIMGFEHARASDLEHERRLTEEAVAAAGGMGLGERVGREWYDHRFDLPYLRDVLLDRGVMVDTLETATVWSNLEALHGAVTGALHRALADWGTPAWVFCHLSHAYEVGASLYFTFLARQDAERPIEQWWAAKQAATDAILANGGALSHHHGVGRDHAAWYGRHAGHAGAALVRGALRGVDPPGLLNPGIFFL